MLVLTEKRSVAEDFAAALSCTRRGGVYVGRDGSTVIVSCVGHLFVPEEPSGYSSDRYVVPNEFRYKVNPNTARQTALVMKVLDEHRSDDILVATDADREGEVIARECLLMAGIRDFSRIRRFWVSQALTPQVIADGIRNAAPIGRYDMLARQGFARQHADWLVGMNFSRYVSSAAMRRLPVGRVQTAVLSAVRQRCDDASAFVSSRYFEHYGIFRPSRDGSHSRSLRGIYIGGQEAPAAVGSLLSVREISDSERERQPPRLYNLGDVQKDAFRCYGYTAADTLAAVQSLYETLKCVSYPRTSSRVMGGSDAALCRSIYAGLCSSYPQYKALEKSSLISPGNTRCFDDGRLAAHHALIPLAPLPAGTDGRLEKIYSLILDRFMLAFQRPHRYLLRSVVVDAGGHLFRISGRRTVCPGWTEHIPEFQKRNREPDGTGEDCGDLPPDGEEWRTMVLSSVETVERWTRPPRLFNEATLLSFMENPSEPDDGGREEQLSGIGTEATRHTVVPKLLACGYVETVRGDIVCTELGRALLDVLEDSPARSLADISETTRWEERLSEDPLKFEEDMRNFVMEAVSQKPAEGMAGALRKDGVPCPVCGRTLREGRKSWFCPGTEEGCPFPPVWKETRGARFSEADVRIVCGGGTTAPKRCRRRDGGEYECLFRLNPGTMGLEAVFGPQKKQHAKGLHDKNLTNVKPRR